MQSKKHIDSQFICKITDMMEKYPEFISWNDNGSELYIADIDQICQKILPEYFRHTNFNSFIRQLNMYSFHKTKKVGRSISFKNQIFKRGNQHNFFQIQRKKKFKQLENYQERFQAEFQDLILQIRNNSQITSQLKETLISLLEYKYVGYENLRRMKCQIQSVYKELKDSRNKKVQEILKQLKVQISTSIVQLSSQAKKIDEFISGNFLKSSLKTIQSLQQIPHEKIFNRTQQNPITIPQSYGLNKTVLKQQSGEKISHEIKENFNSFHSVPFLLQEYKTKRQHFQSKLYNPFNSQNNLVFLPHYIGNPSQWFRDGRYNSMMNQKQDQNGEKNLSLDDQQQNISASISFVKDLSQDQCDSFIIRK